jgi:hypothetical protein
MIAKAIYILCAVTSLFCFVVLFRGYRRVRTRMLAWSSASFLAFAVSNLLLVVDLILLPDVDLLLLRNLVTLIGVLLLLCGLISCA